MTTAKGLGRTRARILYGLVAALLAASLTGCPRNVSRPPGVDCKTWSTPEQVFAALYSFYYREQEAGSPDRVRGPQPFPLETAAEFLRCDPDEEVRSARIRRAAISSASSIILRRCREPDADVKEFWNALAVLRVPKDLVKKLRKKFPHPECAGITPPPVNDEAGAIIDKTKALEDLQRSCCPCIPECKIGPWNGIAVAEFKVEVNRDSGCIFQTIDPQCWGGVCPKNFRNPFVMDKQTCGSSIPPPRPPTCRSTLICDPMLSTPTPVMMAPQPTTPWCGLLSERVITAAYDISTSLETVLKVETTRGSTAGSLIMDYGLCESRGWTICDPACLGPSATSCTRLCNTGNCAVERDCGRADVQSNGAGRAVLAAQKQLRFSAGMKPDMNAWAPLALKVMVTEVADATCRPTSDCSGQPPGACTATTLPVGQKAETCNCKLPQDSCTLAATVIPTRQPPFCPAIAGGG